MINNAKTWFNVVIKLAPPVIIGMKEANDSGEDTKDTINRWRDTITSDEVIAICPQHKEMILQAKEEMKTPEFAKWLDKKLKGYRYK